MGFGKKCYMPEPVIRNMKLVPGPGRYTDLNFKLNNLLEFMADRVNHENNTK